MIGRVHNRRRGLQPSAPLSFLGSCLVALGLCGCPSRLAAAPRIEFILDFSASMNESVGGERGGELVRAALRDAVAVLPRETEVAIRVFGHRIDKGDRVGSCADSELLIPFTPGLSNASLDALERLESRGLTPLARVLTESARDFGAGGGERAIVLITDGADTCDGDPVRVVRDLRAKGFGVTLHVIGVHTTPGVRDELAAIAANGGGTFSSVGDLPAMRRRIFSALKLSFSALKSLAITGVGDLDTPLDAGNDVGSATPLEAGREFRQNHVRGPEDPTDVFSLEVKKGEKYHGVVRFTDSTARGKLTVRTGSGADRATVAVVGNESSFDILDVERDASAFLHLTSEHPTEYSITVTRLVGLP